MEAQKKFGFLSLLSCLLLVACTDPLSHGSGPSQDAVDNAQSSKAATYVAVAPIVKTYCVGCHAGYATYSGLAGEASGIENKVFKTHEMPPTGHAQPSASELATLQAWLAAGAPGDGSVPPVPSPTPVISADEATYTQVAPILKNYCVSCHGGLASYSIAAASAGDITHMVFQLRTMPPAAKPQPTATELATLQAWLAAGAPPDSSVTPTPTPPPESAVPATWSYISANIINAKCVKCHSAGSHLGSLANYNDLMTTVSGAAKVVPGQPENSPLYEVLEDGAKVSMPPLLTGEVVSPAERTAIHDWIAGGALNDLLPGDAAAAR